MTVLSMGARPLASLLVILGASLASGAAYAAEKPEETPTKHAPEWALWTGLRLGFITFANSFYGGSRPDTTGNWVHGGGTGEVDVGARLAKRHVPYLFYEQGIGPPGRRLDGTGAIVTTRFFGLGLRYVALDPDTVGFLVDVSIGWRTLAVYQGGQSAEMSGLETFRLGLGMEIRLSTRMTISPLAYLSGGVMSTTSGSVTFNDGATPPFSNGQGITVQRGYLVFGLGVGAHFDLIGK